MAQPVLQVSGLGVEFHTPRGQATALHDVSLEIGAGETLGLVGESGSGKTLTALSLVRLLPSTARICSGRIILRDDCGTSADGAAPAENGYRDLTAATEEQIRQVRGAKISMIFQEPMTALNPVLTVGDQIGEALFAHLDDPGFRQAELRGAVAGWRSRRQAVRQLVLETMRRVALPTPERTFRYYPHQLSGGGRQRVMIAMALACRPSLLIADEPTTALDVTIQAQILALLRDLQKRFGLALLFISHDLGVVAEIADRVAIMYDGWIVEQGGAAEIFRRPAHPYTAGLLRSAPSLSGAPVPRLPTIEGSVPALGEALPGCPFAPRCPLQITACLSGVPALSEVSPGHFARCIRPFEA